MEDFLQWLRANHAVFPAMRVAVDGTRRSVVADVALQAGQLALHIPQSLMITETMARDTAQARQLAAHDVVLDAYAHLALFVLHTRRHGGFWAPYVAVLPPAFPDLPLFFSADQLRALRGSSLLAPVLQARSLLAQEHRRIAACLGAGWDFSIEEYTWANAAVWSRCFAVDLEDGRGSALVPLADMLDHAARPGVVWTGGVTFGFTMMADRSLAAGSAVCDSYGRRSNRSLLLTYGFCLPDGEPDDTMLHVAELPPTHPCSGLAHALGERHAGMRRFTVSRGYGGATDLFSYLRLAALSRLPAAAPGPVAPQSRVSEIAVLEFVRAACTQRLREFEGSSDSDRALLAQRLPPWQRHVAMVRLAEKNILQELLKLAAEVMPRLANPGWNLAWPACGDVAYAAALAAMPDENCDAKTAGTARFAEPHN